MHPMLARTYGPKYSHFPAYLQPKFNGIRCLVQMANNQITFQSRDEIVWPKGKLAHIEDWLYRYSDHFDGRIVDCELYRHGWKLQRINSAVNVKSSKITLDTREVQLICFDLVEPNETFENRYIPWMHHLAMRLFQENVANDCKFSPVPTELVWLREQVDQHLRYAVQNGFEGVMLRPKDSFYRFGKTDHGTEARTESLWKYKHWEDSDFLCIATTQGQGKADIGIGALVCTTEGGKQFNVGTGFDDRDRAELLRESPVGHFIKVRYNSLTEDGIPQPAIFLQVLY